MTENLFWFSDWQRAADIAAGAVFFYLLIVVMVRLQGKRTTSQLNNFDWIITITIGSLAASGILLRDIPVSEAALAILVVSGCQWIITWIASRWDWFSGLIRASPRMLLHKGDMLEDEMRKERITQAELRSRLRAAGLESAEGANWVVLETDGTLTVIPRSEAALADTGLMSDVKGDVG